MHSFGILANAIGDPYSLRLMHATAQELVKEGSHALCFMGGFPHAPLFRDASDRQVLPLVADAWILIAETLRASPVELERLVAGGKPCLSVGLELNGTPSITASDEAGIFQAVAHLSRRHDRRRIAFVGGPAGSVDAARRLAAYRMALESVGLNADPALFASGDYEARSGREAVRQLQRQAKRYDAVVAANDLMAIGVIEALRANGQRVPEDISVIGFDDMEEASFASPALTTVRQPLQDLGASAARIAIAQVRGAGVEQKTVVTSPLVIRESCGCRPEIDPPDRRSLPPGIEPARKHGLREVALRELVRRELASSRTHRELSILGERIVAASDFPELADVLGEVCRLLSLRRFVLSSYGGGQRHARVTLEWTGTGVVFHQHTQTYPVEAVFPPAFRRGETPAQIVVEPLELAGEQFGYLVLEGDVRDGQAYLELRRQLSTALARMAYGRELRRLYAAEKKRG
jgi:DNA-binding LacI/PurR family transcriptional regulator